MKAKQVNKAYPDHSVFVNEHLSPKNQVFLAHLKKKCKDVGICYVWCRDGKFFVRRASGEKCQRVDSYDDMSRLKSKVKVCRARCIVSL